MRRTNEYKSWNRKVKELVESKTRVDEEFGRNLSENFTEDNKLFWKEVKRERERCEWWECESEERG